MSISAFDIFSIGIGPSSSHTIGPMRAARQFLEGLPVLEDVARVHVELFGSLALTGIGHGSDRAIVLGLMGELPEEVEPERAQALIAKPEKLLGRHPIDFNATRDISFTARVPEGAHPNTVTFTAFCGEGTVLARNTYYSIGGGFIVDAARPGAPEERSTPPYPFSNSAELLRYCTTQGCSIPELQRRNERSWYSDEEIDKGLLHIWKVMQQAVERGCTTEGVLPGGLNVQRRAAALRRQLEENGSSTDPCVVMDWVSLWAIAVNEENAAGGRVVTAPTNGASGIIPSVLYYYNTFTENPSDRGVIDFLLTAAAVAILYKKGASVSGAEMGCQGEVGVACSMAAAGLVAALAGTTIQMECAAEIGIEHNLGLTCDPVKGLVQIPCIERNAMGAVKAINAARLALHGNGLHKVTLDQAIATMRQVGHDMNSIYKETSQGGLAVNVVEC